MVKEVKWTKYLWLSLLSFGAFMLEYLSIFAIEVIFLHVDIQNYTMQQRSIHCIIMVFMWAFFIGVLLLFSRKHYHFPERGSKRDKISSKSWIVTLACFIGCKIMTFIDWHTLKIVGEAQGKTVFQFCAQYLYYIFEVMLVILIIIYGQKAIETLLKKESPIPFGGIILAMTWGAFHFVSRGVGLEIWNGISTMIFSVLSGVMYLRLNRQCLYSYLFIAVASLAAVAFAGLSVYLFFVTFTGKFNDKKWLSVFNLLLIMLVLIILSKILPANKVINGVFAWGQQSLALFITFMMFLIYSIRYSHNELSDNKKE